MSLAPETRQGSLKAKWSSEEINALLDLLERHKPMGGDTVSYKQATWTAAVAHLAPLYDANSGPPKDADRCMRKWQTLKNTYGAIQDFRNHSSGFHWDNQHGAGVRTPSEQETFNSYVSVKSHSAMKPFATKGWEYYDKMHALIGDTSRGSYAYRPSRSAAPNPTDLEGNDGNPARGPAPTATRGDPRDGDAVHSGRTVGTGDALQDEDIVHGRHVVGAGQPAFVAIGSDPRDAAPDNGMDVDLDENQDDRSRLSVPSSLTTGKRKSFTPDTSFISSSSATTPQSGPSRSKKSRSSGVSGISGSAPKQITSTKMSQNVLLSNLQASVNRLSDAISTTVSDDHDPVAILREAVLKLETNDDDLTADEIGQMLDVVTKDIRAASVYNSLVRSDLRVSYVRRRISEL